ncbi:MAG: VWA domain-containing protein [bacterium]|nr:VWA domain-containing protein [bacterium]
MRADFEHYRENGGIARPADALDIFIAYSPESQQYMPGLIERFNRASVEDGVNPATGAPWGEGERPVYVRGQQPTSGSSGSLAQGVINAFIAPGNAQVYHPTILQPSVSHWLALVNYSTGREVLDLAASQPTALSPVVIGMWESRVRAIQQTIGRESIGWDDLLGVLNSPNGWCDYGIPEGQCRRAVYYGHTDPNISSTGLSTTIAEFYACARENGFTDRLTTQAVNDAEVQACVRGIEALVRHYSRRTEDFLEYFSRGPEYLDFLALEETDLICLNRGAQQGDEVCRRPQERLIAIYPEEGTFWHEHPFAVVNGDWVTDQMRAAAGIFTAFVLLPESQQTIMAEGFRPANPDVPLAFPFTAENGVDVNQPRAVLSVPAPEVIAAIQASWSVVKKQADVVMLIDTSGSMEDEDRIGQARAAAEAFMNAMDSGNRVALWTFSDELLERVPLDNAESARQAMYSNIRSLRASGGTELFYAVEQTVRALTAEDDESRIRAVIVLSDGADTGSRGVTLNDAVNAIAASAESANPVIVIPVAYGSSADMNALGALARASDTSVQSGGSEDIDDILQLLSSFF